MIRRGNACALTVLPSRRRSDRPAHSSTAPSSPAATATGFGYIDPAPFMNSDGAAYLYVSVDAPYHAISVLRGLFRRPCLLDAGAACHEG